MAAEKIVLGKGVSESKISRKSEHVIVSRMNNFNRQMIIDNCKYPNILGGLFKIFDGCIAPYKYGGSALMDYVIFGNAVADTIVGNLIEDRIEIMLYNLAYYGNYYAMRKFIEMTTTFYQAMFVETDYTFDFSFVNASNSYHNLNDKVHHYGLTFMDNDVEIFHVDFLLTNDENEYRCLLRDYDYRLLIFDRDNEIKTFKDKDKNNRLIKDILMNYNDKIITTHLLEDSCEDFCKIRKSYLTFDHFYEVFEKGYSVKFNKQISEVVNYLLSKLKGNLTNYDSEIINFILIELDKYVLVNQYHNSKILNYYIDNENDEEILRYINK